MSSQVAINTYESCIQDEFEYIEEQKNENY